MKIFNGSYNESRRRKKSGILYTLHFFSYLEQQQKTNCEKVKMGNCLRHESSNMVWARDDLEPVSPTGIVAEKESLLGINTNNSKRGMKIRITKKELEEMLGRVNMQMQGVTVDQVLSAMLMNSRADGSHHHNIQRKQFSSWRPRLQRIPEVY
ncbi:uncharacterized protein [Nicotiana tomentosiformis]|uniref:uncharacterized protein n=1 Tax=Nicotiana tomentosiformis TaxID=4098 RepID=UPI00388CD111